MHACNSSHKGRVNFAEMGLNSKSHSRKKKRVGTRKLDLEGDWVGNEGRVHVVHGTRGWVGQREAVSPEQQA